MINEMQFWNAIKFYLMVLVTTVLAGCGASDAYPKYKEMKAQSIWMLATCEQQVSDPIYIYRGFSSAIRQACRKTSNSDKWWVGFKNSLAEKGWVLRSADSSNMYCLRNTGIVLFVKNYAYSEGDITMQFYYPASDC